MRGADRMTYLKPIRTLTLACGLLMLLGCAGSPLHTGSLSPETLRAVDNYTLCKAYTPRPLGLPQKKWSTFIVRKGRIRDGE